MKCICLGDDVIINLDKIFSITKVITTEPEHFDTKKAVLDADGFPTSEEVEVRYKNYKQNTFQIHLKILGIHEKEILDFDTQEKLDSVWKVIKEACQS